MRSPLPRHPAAAGSTCNAAAGSTLAILHPTTRYAAVQAVELRLAAPGAAQLAGPWLWRLPASCSTASGRPSLQQLVGVQALLVPLARASSFERLLDDLASRDPLPAGCRWSLSVAVHGQRSKAARDSDAARATDYLCAVAQRLAGAPALGLPGATELRLLRTPRLWYLAEVVAGQEAEGGALAAVWAARPYSFSASTDLRLARLAVSVAWLSTRGAAPHGTGGGGGDGGGGGEAAVAGAAVAGGAAGGAAASPMMLDPCCGSGTVLYAAASLGLRAVGCDLNPTAIRGAEQNLRHCGEAQGWGQAGAPTALLHDSCAPLPEQAAAVQMVVASLPWGRQQRIPHKAYLPQMLSSLAGQVRLRVRVRVRVRVS